MLATTTSGASQAAALSETIAAVSAHQELARVYLPKLFANDPETTELLLQDSMCNDLSLMALCDALGRNTAVTALDLSSNDVGDTGVAFLVAVLRKPDCALRKLVLDRNRITNEGARELVAAMEENVTIQSLSLTRNVSIDDPHVLHELESLTQLNLLPPGLKAAVLSLRRGTVGDRIVLSRVETATREFRDVSHDTRDHIDDAGTELLAEAMMAHSNKVTLLDLSYNHITDRGAKALADMVALHRTLDRLVLTGNCISSAGVRDLVVALGSNNSVRYIDIFSNAVPELLFVDLEIALSLNRQPLTLKKAFQRLQDNDPTLVHISLDDSASQRFYNDISARLLTEVLVKNHTLLSLAVNRSRITGVGARFLGDVLCVTQTLRSLDLSFNPLGEGAEALAKGLQVNRSLQTLRLVATEMPDSTAAAFAEMLAVNTTLLELDLSCNSAISKSGDAFAQSFSVNTTLLRLGLDDTNVAPTAMQVVEDRMRMSQQPQRLRDILPFLFAKDESVVEVLMPGEPGVSQPLRDDSVRMICAPLEKNFIVSRLDLSGNEIGYDGLTTLAKMLLDNRVTLQFLDLSDNPIGHGYETGRLLGAVIRSHAALATIRIANIGFDTAGCRQVINELDVDRINILTAFDISRNPEVDAASNMKCDALVATNSLPSSAKSRIRRFIREWEDNDSRAFYENHVADFSRCVVLGSDGSLSSSKQKTLTSRGSLFGRKKSSVTGDAASAAAAAATASHVIQAAVLASVDGDNEEEQEESVQPPSLGDKAVAIICRVMAHARGFKTLLLKSNHVGDEGCRAVARLLRESPHGLTSVDLSGNDISDAGVEALAVAARQSHNVRVIAVHPSERPISKAASEVLDIALRFNMQHPEVKQLLEQVAENSPTRSVIDFSKQLNHHMTDLHVALLCQALSGNQYVKKIDLSNNHIHNEGFGELCRYLSTSPTVEKLSMKNCLIEGLPVARMIHDLIASPLTAITSIDVSYNDLSDDVVPLLLEAVRACRTVLHLGLRECGISPHLVAMISNSCSVNSEATLSELVQRLRANDPTVREVRSSGLYTDAQATEILASVERNTHVTTVDFANCKLTDVSGVAIMKALRTNASVTEINLSNNCFGAATVAALVEAAQTNKTLEVVQLSSNNLSRDAVASLEGLLAITDTLHTLELDGNQFDLAKEPYNSALTCMSLNRQLVLKGAVQRLRDDDPSLIILDLNDAAANDGAGASKHVGRHNDVGCRVLGAALHFCTHLTSLVLSHGEIGDDGMAALCSGLSVNRSVALLDVSHNRFADKGLTAIASMLQVNNVVNRLQLRSNGPYKSQTLQYLFEVLVNNHNVVALDIDDTGRKVEETGAPATMPAATTAAPIAGGGAVVDAAPSKNEELRNEELGAIGGEVMLNNRHLALKHLIHTVDEVLVTEVDVSRAAAQGRVFDNEACAVLCELLCGNKFVSRVDMSHNSLGFESAYAIGAMLQRNARVTSLNLAMNNILDGCMTIVDALVENSSLTSLNLDGNGCSSITTERAELLLSLNREPLAMKRAVLKLLEKDVTHTRVSVRCPDIELLENRKLQLDDDSARLLVSLLRTDLVVRSVDVDWNAIRDAGAASVASLVRCNDGINSVSLAHNFVGDEGLLALCEAALCSPHLEHVNLRHNVITGACEPHVIRTLRACPWLKSILLQGNRMPQRQVEGLQFLGDVNNYCGGDFRMQVLDMYDNSPARVEALFTSALSMGDWNSKSAGIVAYALKRNTFVTKLHLDLNDITSEQLGPLELMLRTNTTLDTLSLAHNHIVDVSGLCDALRVNKTVRTIDLRSNRLNVESAKSFAALLREIDVLTDLDLSCNCLGRVGVSILVGALPMNDSLVRIDVTASDVPAALAEEAQHATTLHYKHIALKGEPESEASSPLVAATATLEQPSPKVGLMMPSVPPKRARADDEQRNRATFYFA